MANKFTRFLKTDSFGAQLANGLLNPKGVMGNFQHATRLYVDDYYRLAPRTKFLYYVRFEIDPTSHNATTFNNRDHASEVGYLVKTADLPKFTIDSEIKNQYNRKKIVYKMINYDTLNLTFHDDNAGIINALWAIYYGTYVADRHLPTQAYSDTKYRPVKIDALDNFRYGLDNNKTVDMFKSITIYTMSRRRYLGYTLINPKIKSWSHGSVDQTSSEFNENTMSIDYEAVQYSSGQVSYDNPKGFATLHYDLTPSPLTVQGGGVGNVFGEGGILDGLESIFGDVSKGTTFGSVGGFIGTAIKAANTYKNYEQFKSKSKGALGREVINILSNPTAVRGVIGAVFPKNTPSGETTTATPKILATGGEQV